MLIKLWNSGELRFESKSSITCAIETLRYMQNGWLGNEHLHTLHNLGISDDIIPVRNVNSDEITIDDVIRDRYVLLSDANRQLVSEHRQQAQADCDEDLDLPIVLDESKLQRPKMVGLAER